MNVLECSHRVGSLAQVPHIEAWILIVIIGNYELCRLLRVPHHAGSLHSVGALLLAWITEVGLGRSRLRLSELED